MLLNVGIGVVGASAATEAGVGAQIAATTSAAAEAITGVLPMGADLDSIQFAAAMNAAGASYIAAAGEHLANRNLFASAQGLAAVTYAASDAVNNAALAL